MTTNGRTQGRKSLRWIALIFVVAITPFCWLVVRDLLFVFEKGEGQGRASIVADRLVQNAGIPRDIPLTDVPIQTPSCYVLENPVVRPSDTPAEDDKASERLGFLDTAFIHHAALAEQMAVRMDYSNRARRIFSTEQVILLNACIEATPFTGMCRGYFRRQMTANYAAASVASNELRAELGILRRSAVRVGNGQPLYCSTMPEIVTGKVRR